MVSEGEATLAQHLKARGVTIIFISHRLEELFAVADRVTVMRDGQYVATKNIAEIDRPQLIAMMAGREMRKATPPAKRRSARKCCAWSI